MSLAPQRYARASEFLASLDEDWASHVRAVGACLHQPKPARDPYEALGRAIAYQQLHTRAGDAIVGRLLALSADGAFPSAQALLEMDVDTLRGCGFSTRKIATLHGIAQARASGLVPDREEALAMSDDALIERLTCLHGVGRWTVEMLMIYTLERDDILPADDFGVREGYRRLKGLEQQPTRKQMQAFGEAFSPHRTAAAWYLWRVPAPAKVDLKVPPQAAE